ncbi:MAG: FAD-binding protein [Clostridia bacterium]|nr:FAD-binding protein [Clostridia bacterium]
MVRRSVDARKKDQVHFVYSVDVALRRGEEKLLARHRNNPEIMQARGEEAEPDFAPAGKLGFRPVVVGAGPAGIFAALTLAWHGYRPLVLEQGQDVTTRAQDVQHFWSTGELDPLSNVQFGEGGAGAFSDGKLTTRISDRRINKVLRAMVEAGAPEEILYLQKPHVGTDRLKTVVANLRKMLIAAGGEVRFGAQVTQVLLEKGRVTGVEVTGRTGVDFTNRTGDTGSGIEVTGRAEGDSNRLEVTVVEIPTQAVILALGHSSRETYRMLDEKGVAMEAKALAIGVRIEHPQELIDQAQYGEFAGHPKLGAAEYQLTYQDKHSGRSAYTFCMCPGGVVVGAASGKGQLVTNGMSNYARDTGFANSALVASVRPDDYPGDHPLSGIEFLEKWERAAFELGGGSYFAPATTVGDFLAGQPSRELPEGTGTYRPGLTPADISRCLPDYVAETLEKAIIDMGRKLRGFDLPGALLTGVETRTSAPVRILREKDFQAEGIAGLYPAGEGAGYAGGIMSAAVDGIRVAEAVIRQFARIG